MKALSTAVLFLATLASVNLHQLTAPNFYQVATGMKGIYYSSAAYCKYETLDNWTCGKPCEENAGI